VPSGGSADSGPVSEPLKMPPTSYSRDDMAVVSGAVVRCVSSLADSVRVHPSGVVVVAGGDDSTRPSSGGGGGGAVCGEGDLRHDKRGVGLCGCDRSGWRTRDKAGGKHDQRTNHHSAALLGRNTVRQRSLPGR